MPCLLAAAILLPSEGRSQSVAGPLEVQSIRLKEGWNAIFLRIDPVQPEPGAVFGGLPVTKVTTYFPTRTPVEYIQDPGSVSWKQVGWRAWFSPESPEAPLSDLYAIQGGQGYLVQATTNTVLNLQGKTAARSVRWKADSYNFVGFPVDEVAPPTFAQWFAGSPAHRSTTRPTVYVLGADHRWRPVDRPESTLIQAGTAYWVYCQGGSDYQGPLDVSMVSGVRGGGVNFGDVTEAVTVRFRNTTPVPMSFSLSLTPTNLLPVLYEQRVAAQAERLAIPLEGTVAFGPLEPEESRNVRLVLDRALMSRVSGSALLNVRDDVGGWIRIPVNGNLP